MSFVDDYISYASDFTDAPKKFHEAMGYFCLSSIVGNRCSIDVGQNGLFPVFWVILIAPSGFYRKSTSLSIAQNLIMSADPICVIGSQFNQKQLIETLGHQTASCTFYGEFAKMDKRMTATLTEMFDCPPFLPGGRFQASMDVTYPFLNIGSASTPLAIKRSMEGQDGENGFIPRFLNIVATEERETKPMMGKHDEDKYAKLTNFLMRLKARSGKFNYSIEGYTVYTKWFTEFIEKANLKNSAFLIRLCDYAHKVALLDHLGSSTDGYEIHESSVLVGTKFADSVFEGIKSLG